MEYVKAKKVFRVSKKYAMYSSAYFSLTLLVGNLSMSGVLLYGITLCAASEITAGTLASFLMYCGYVGFSGMFLSKTLFFSFVGVLIFCFF